MSSRIRVAHCPVQSVLPGSTFLAHAPAESSPRMNSPRKSRVAEVPSVFFTPFEVPSAGDQFAGQEVQKNAITAPVGTERPFKSSRFETIAFHASLVSACPAVTGKREENAAYAEESPTRVVKNTAAEIAGFLYSEMKLAIPETIIDHHDCNVIFTYFHTNASNWQRCI